MLLLVSTGTHLLYLMYNHFLTKNIISSIFLSKTVSLAIRHILQSNTEQAGVGRTL
jgi:hypothetical protein